MQTALIPYLKDNTLCPFSDEFIMGLYNKMVSDGTADLIFLNGTIQSAENFLHLVSDGGSYLYIYFKEKDPVGMCWLNSFENRTARFHFCIFSEVWGEADDIGRETVQKLIRLKDEDGYLFDMFIGLVPTQNKLAIDYVQRIGANYLGELPFGMWNHKTGKSESATLVYYVREWI